MRGRPVSSDVVRAGVLWERAPGDARRLLWLFSDVRPEAGSQRKPAVARSPRRWRRRFSRFASGS